LHWQDYIVKTYPLSLDMDDLIFSKLSNAEAEYVCSDPWTPKIGDFMTNAVRERLAVEPGKPIFGTVVMPCDLIVYLKISDSLLQERTALRGKSYIDAKNMQQRIEKDIMHANLIDHIRYIRLLVG